MPKKIWIDLSNAPHVLFFKPAIEALEKKNTMFVITARQQEQLVELLDMFGIRYFLTGRYGGAGLLNKILRMLERIFRLVVFAVKEKPDVVVAHQSFYAIIAGFLARVPKRVYFFDNEKAWIQNLLAIPFATHIICPRAIPLNRLFFRKLIKYDGIKEEVYLHGFRLRKNERNGIMRKLAIPRGKKIVVFRPEPYTAHYYSSRSKRCHQVLDHLVKRDECFVIVVPRDESQRKEYASSYKKGNNVLVLENVVNLPALLSLADLVISAGGTVVREAAVLGKPAISIYEGKPLAVDLWLAKNNHLFFLDEKNVSKLDEFIKSRRFRKYKSKNIDILRYIS